MIRNSGCPGVAWSAVLDGAEFIQTVWKTRMLGTALEYPIAAGVVEARMIEDTSPPRGPASASPCEPARAISRGGRWGVAWVV